MTVTEKDRDILARTLWGEARGESLSGQIAVAWTIRNRVNDGKTKSWWGEGYVGVAVLMYLVQADVNGGNGAWILINSLGGAQQVAVATKSQHAVQLGQSQTMFSSLVGTATNVKMAINAASASAALTADEIIVGTALGGQTYRLAAFNKTINLGAAGAGGMDTGAAPVNGYVAIYAIYNPTTNNSALMATNATSVAAGSVYSGANMPAGYTASALISVWGTNGSGQFIAGMQVDRNISIAGATVLNTSSIVVTPITLSLAAVVPKNARFVSGVLIISAPSAGTLGLSIYASDSAVGEQGVVVNGTGLRAPFSRAAMVTAQTVRWSSSSAAASPTFQIIVTSYDL